MMQTYHSPFAASSLKPRSLPGDLTSQSEIARMLRVNQAGEYGAKRIYQGQIDMLGGSDKKEILIHMAEQEQAHLDYFNKAIIDLHTRPSALSMLWHIGGYTVGALPSLLGTEAAMAVTVAVEETIDEHYETQAERLEQRGDCPALLGAVRKFQAEEAEHRDIGLAHDAEQAPAWVLLHWLVKQTSKISIFLAERI